MVPEEHTQTRLIFFSFQFHREFTITSRILRHVDVYVRAQYCSSRAVIKKLTP